MAHFREIATFVRAVSEAPEEFFTSSETLAQRVRRGLKAIFDHSASAIRVQGDGRHPVETALPMTELYTEGFDAEGIWGELQMQHASVLGKLSSQLRRLEKAKDVELVVPEEAVAARKRARVGGASAPTGKPARKLSRTAAGPQARELVAEDAGSLSMEEEEEEGEEDEASARARRRMEAFDEEGTSEGEEEEDEDASEGGDGEQEDMAAFIREGETAFAKLKAIQAGKAAPEEDDSDEEGERGGEDDDDMGDIELNAPIPDDAGAALSAVLSKSKAAKLKALLSGGPTYEDMYGKRALSTASRKAGRPEESEEGVEEEEDEGVEEEEGDGQKDGSLGSAEDEFIDHMGSGDEEEEDEEEEEAGQGGKRVARRRRLLEEEQPPEDVDMDADDDGDEDGEEEEEEEEGGVGSGRPERKLTRHEQERAKKAAEIAGLEHDMLSDKPWWMQGEVGSTKRPLNSLLAADLDYQQATKAPPVVTVETTVALEDLIRQRVADAAYDDPLRKEARSVTATERAAQVAPELSTERPSGGLADVYAAEYAAKAMGATPRADKVDALEAEAEALLAKVLHKLDALSNWQYTPKPAPRPDMAIERTNLPALAMEDATPTSASGATGATPQEAYATARGRDGVLRSRGEQSSGERTSARQSKKAATRKDARRRAAEEKAVAKANPGLGNKYAKQKALDEIRAGSKSGAVKIGSGVALGKRGADLDAASRPKDGLQGGQEFSGAAASAGIKHGSSAAFFSLLQDEARAKITSLGGGAAAGGSAGATSKGSQAQKFKM